ncbi:MAG: hypothetical protein KJ737_18355 [Proteobacteria bacterium]|nr:hypothetical protein [Pseudomonadota bacterium]
MKRVVLWVVLWGMTCLVVSGCFNKVPPFSGNGAGKWELILNGNIKYTFDFDKKYFESNYKCEIGCSGQIQSWAVADGVLSGMTKCDTIYVTYEGESDKSICEGSYKVYTVSGELLREGVFTGKML